MNGRVASGNDKGNDWADEEVDTCPGMNCDDDDAPTPWVWILLRTGVLCRGV